LKKKVERRTVGRFGGGEDFLILEGVGEIYEGGGKGEGTTGNR